ncbi:MAG: hypothetical protein JXA57_00380, partial [Armatimonadetes bacterium]|nr:hypothetical protein [Armatimonadota bacterium]
FSPDVCDLAVGQGLLDVEFLCDVCAVAVLSPDDTYAHLFSPMVKFDGYCFGVNIRTPTKETDLPVPMRPILPRRLAGDCPGAQAEPDGVCVGRVRQ